MEWSGKILAVSFCRGSGLLSCAKRLVGVLPSLVKHSQDKELHLRQAALEV